jgi:hypothetical protein
MARLRVVALTLLAQGAEPMLPPDLKNVFAKSIIQAKHTGGIDARRLNAFLVSDDYRESVLPLLQKVEGELLDRWLRFSASEEVPLPLQDFSGLAPLPTNNAILGLGKRD